MKLAAVILAGGLASRMGGGDKALLPLGQGVIAADAVAVLSDPQQSQAPGADIDGSGGESLAISSQVRQDG